VDVFWEIVYIVLGIDVSLSLCCAFIIVGLYVVELLRMNESSGMSALLCKTKALFFAFLLMYFLCVGCVLSIYKMSALHVSAALIS